ncbi:hypothetical protein GDO78_017901 [Eleutherodactylus coqui]|uniref:Uncharacterized protein n=1 Tax=Eleutherodactylus coqui TaxID=57060 RepID=A0A8J6EJK0_ELECQ|nr:hypothetical protein GDO78_017901 [Eleutherodactylus coqui]
MGSFHHLQARILGSSLRIVVILGFPSHVSSSVQLVLAWIYLPFFEYSFSVVDFLLPISGFFHGFPLGSCHPDLFEMYPQ